MTEKIKQILEVINHKVARELNRRKFIKLWKKRYGERVVEWRKVRQSNHLELEHIGLKTIGEYWETRKFTFIQDMEGKYIQGELRREPWRHDIFWI